MVPYLSIITTTTTTIIIIMHEFESMTKVFLAACGNTPLVPADRIWWHCWWQVLALEVDFDGLVGYSSHENLLPIDPTNLHHHRSCAVLPWYVCFVASLRFFLIRFGPDLMRSHRDPNESDKTLLRILRSQQIHKISTKSTLPAINRLRPTLERPNSLKLKLFPGRAMGAVLGPEVIR